MDCGKEIFEYGSRLDFVLILLSAESVQEAH